MKATEEFMMHSVIRPDGSRKRDLWIKYARIMSYTLMSAGGGLLMFSPVVLHQLGHTVLVMSAFMFLGGMMSALGAIFERWAGEFVGLPLLFSPFMVLAISVISVAPSTLSAGNGALLAGIALALFARWREVKAIYWLALYLTRRGSVM